MMRIAIVNDMMMAVEILRRVILTVPDYQIAWIAKNGLEAVTKCAQDTPDLILMDMMMPLMDGVEATRQIMQKSPCSILIVTSSIKTHLSQVFEAMGYGARDVVRTPILGNFVTSNAAQPLLAKITTIGKLIGKSPLRPKSPPLAAHVPPPFPHFYAPIPPLVIIGASTGGPKALATILSHLPPTFPAAIVIIQHVDVQFAPGLADWLNHQTPLMVKVALEGEHLEAGKVFIAATNDHLVLRKNLTLQYTEEPLSYPYRPSVDAFLKSAAQYWPSPETAILLTGMGRDGADGLHQLRGQGWHTIAQSQDSCVVYGMPKAAVELGAAVEILSPEAIASILIRRITHQRQS